MRVFNSSSEQNSAIYISARIETRNTFKLYGSIKYTAKTNSKLSIGYVLLLLRPLFNSASDPSLLTNQHLFDRVAKAYTKNSYILHPYRSSLPYRGWWSGWQRFSAVVLRSTPRSIVTDRGEPQRTAVIASDHGNRRTVIQSWCTVTTSRLTVKIFTRANVSLIFTGKTNCFCRVEDYSKW